MGILTNPPFHNKTLIVYRTEWHEWQVFSLILNNSIGLSAGIQSAGDSILETLIRILHLAEEDNFYDSKIACLCQSIEINNIYVYGIYIYIYIYMCVCDSPKLLVQALGYHQIDAKPLPEPMLTYYIGNKIQIICCFRESVDQNIFCQILIILFRCHCDKLDDYETFVFTYIIQCLVWNVGYCSTAKHWYCSM